MSIQKAVVILHEMSADEQMREMARLREKAILDEKSAANFARREGKAEGKAEAVKNMLKKNISIETALELVGLDRETYEKFS